VATNLPGSLLQNSFPHDSCSCSFLLSQPAHRASKGFAMGATTKSISGLFANVCGRNVCGRMLREHFAAGHGTRSAAIQGYLSLSFSCLSHASWRDRFSSLVRISGLDTARDQARWPLKRLGGQLSSALPNMSGILRSAWYPTSFVPQAAGHPRTGVRRFPG
jgi:hypothetical protein